MQFLRKAVKVSPANCLSEEVVKWKLHPKRESFLLQKARIIFTNFGKTCYKLASFLKKIDTKVLFKTNKIHKNNKGTFNKYENLVFIN